MKRIAVFTATRWEQAAVGRALQIDESMRVGRSACLVGRGGSSRVYVFRTGIGPVMAGTVCREALAAQPWDLAVSSGFACALIPSHIGALLIATEVRSRPEVSGAAWQPAIACAAAPSALAERAAREAGLAVQSGAFVSSSEVLWRGEQKQRLAAETGAAGLDMESGAVAAAAAERQVPFVVTRSVSDLQDEDLPLDFNLFLRPASWPRGAWQALLTPSCLAGLQRLRRQSRLAGDHLTRFMQGFLGRLGQA